MTLRTKGTHMAITQEEVNKNTEEAIHVIDSLNDLLQDEKLIPEIKEMISMHIVNLDGMVKSSVFICEAGDDSEELFKAYSDVVFQCKRICEDLIKQSS